MKSLLHSLGVVVLSLFLSLSEDAQGAIQDKTLVAWASPANLTQRGGSVLTLEDQHGHFDGIVFGELSPAKWMAGSDAYNRTQKDQKDYAAETADPNTQLQMAIVYRGRQITVYRNGKEYSRHEIDEPLGFGNDNVVVIGLRHIAEHVKTGFAGAVSEARIYNVALSPEQIAALEPAKLSEVKPLAWWLFKDGLADRMGKFPVGRLVGGARLADGKLLLDGQASCFVTPPDAIPESTIEIPHYDSPIHYRPAVSAMADTIPFYWKGEYHVFYLHVTKDTPWEHIVSRDLVHWRELPTALVSNPPLDGPDGANMFTGSVTEKDGTFHIFYTGHNDRNPNGVEFVCHATSPDLVTWTKHPEDVLAPDGVIYDNRVKRDFRDPYVFFNETEHCWWMVFFGNDAKTKRGVQGLAVSDDLKHWRFQPPLEGADGQECPDLFSIGDTWYLIGGDHYSIAKNPRGPYQKPPVSNLIDRPNVYAAKRMFDGKRHIWTGWVWDRPSHRDGSRGAWGGTQCLPRELYAGPEGQLYSRPAPEVVSVFKKTLIEKSGVALDQPCVFDLPDHYLLECELQMEPQAELAIGLRQQAEHDKAYRFVLNPAKKLVQLSGPKFKFERPCPVDVSKPVKVQIFVQGTIIECFVNDQFAQACRGYDYQHGKLGFEVAGGSAKILSLAVKQPEAAATGSAASPAANINTDNNPVVSSAQEGRITYEPAAGAGQGKHIVFVCGEWEYRCEESLPMLARILAKRHGFKCTVLFSMNPKDGTVDPGVKNNIPGMSVLKEADMMVLFAMDLTLPEEQMKPFVEFLESGKPVFGIRCSLLSFKYPKESPYARFDVGNGGYARELFGEQWRGHYGAHGKESSRGLRAGLSESNPILRGVNDVWGPTDVYRVTKLPADATVLMYGQVLEGMKPEDRPNLQKAIMPMVWTREIKRDSGAVSRVVVSTIGAAQDMESEDLRRLYVNGIFWAVGLGNSIPTKADVGYVGGDWKASPFGGGKFHHGLKPADFAVK